MSAKPPPPDRKHAAGKPDRETVPFAELLKKHREEAGLSQGELGRLIMDYEDDKALQKGQVLVSAYEGTRRREPVNLATLVKIARILKTDPNTLLGWKKSKRSANSTKKG